MNHFIVQLTSQSIFSLNEGFKLSAHPRPLQHEGNMHPFRIVVNGGKCLKHALIVK